MLGKIVLQAFILQTVSHKEVLLINCSVSVAGYGLHFPQLDGIRMVARKDGGGGLGM